MATDLQTKALEILVEAGRTKKRIIKGQVLVKAGYSKKTAIAPSKVFESKGFKDLCDELGLTESFLTKALVEDIEGKPRQRKAELELGFKVRGILNGDGEGKGNIYNFNFIQEKQLKRIAARVLNGNSESEGEINRFSDSNEPEV